MRRQIVFERGLREEEVFGSIIGSELGRGHEHRTHAVGRPAPHQALPALLPRHPDQAIGSVLVVPALSRGQGGIMLHSHVQDIGGVSCDAAEEAGGGGHGDEGGEGGGGAGGCESGF